MNTVIKQISALCLLLMASACTQEEMNENGQLPDGVYPLQIASVCVGGEEGAATRIAENGDGSYSVFKKGDIFNVKFNDREKTGTYKIKDELGTVEPVSTIYWTKSQAEVFGWYPQETSVNLSDQSSQMAYVMRADPQKFYYKGEANTLIFSNQLAKVRVRFEFFDVAEKSIEIDKMQIKSYTSCTHEKGMVALPDASASEDYIQMHKATYNNKTYWEANLVPGTINAEEALKFKKNDVEETFTLDSNIALEAGKISFITIPVHNSSYEYVCLNKLTTETTISKKSILTGMTSQKIKIADGCDVTLCGAIINNQIKCEGDATIHLLSDNVVTCSSGDRAGIEVGPKDKTLKIDGNGKLTVTGSGNAAGIGSGYVFSGVSCGNIIISGGTIIATGGSNAAGIGSGWANYWGNNSCGDITISGGTVIASGGQRSAGIGSGYGYEASSYCGAITISGGTITANGQNGAGIGSGYKRSYCGDITISGGTITATGQNGAGIGCGYYRSSCGAITISGVNGMRVNSGANNSACIGKGAESGNVGEIKVTDSTITLDNSGGTNAPYFNPSPTDTSGSTFYDKVGNVITL